MSNVSYVYPNVSEITQRGSLRERWGLAKMLGCDYVEVPADFIKNGAEMLKTHLNLGDFLTEDAIRILYDNDNVPSEAKYILHTEPSFSRSDGNTHKVPPLQWFDEKWVEKFVDMLLSLSNFFKLSPSIVEIHPGNRRNSFKDILVAAKYLMDKLNDRFGFVPFIFLENRTGQFISTGVEIAHFYNFLMERFPSLENKFGVILDIQQLYTTTKKRFLGELKIIPLGAVKGLHIHRRHDVPKLSDEIPWKEVFDKIKKAKNNLIINPEIHHKNKVKDAIAFCENLMNLPT